MFKKETNWDLLKRINKLKNTPFYQKINYDHHQATSLKLHVLSQNDPFYNYLHLAPYSGLLNDPNGLIYDGNNYHIFYQWSPFLATHSLKHWGHFTTKDFLHFEHQPLAIKPSLAQDIDGIYSGGALAFDNKMYLYWTGNVKKDIKTQQRSSYTLVSQWSNNNLVNKKVLFEVDHNCYTRHFRDPKPLKINNHFYLLHGAQTLDSKGEITVYISNDVDKNFVFYGNVKFKNFNEDLGFMIECPDFVTINNCDIFIFSTQGKKYHFSSLEKGNHLQNQHRDQSVYVLGHMNWATLEFEVITFGFLDYGFDFYAPQIFANTSPKLMGWVGMPDDEMLPHLSYQWAHNLSLVRQLDVINHKLMQKPLSNYDQLLELPWQKSNNVIEPKSRQLKLKAKVLNNQFILTFKNSQNHAIVFQYSNGILTIDRSNMSYHSTLNDGHIWSRELFIDNFELFLDQSIIEIFFNNGVTTFTTKYWIDQQMTIEFENLDIDYAYMKKININWQKDKVFILPGEALIDRYIDKTNNKITDKVGGAPLNVAIAISKWDFATHFIGSIGQDVEGQQIMNFFDNFKLSKKYLNYMNNVPTTIAQVTLDQNGERNFVFQRGADNSLNFYSIDYDCLILSSATAFLTKESFDIYLQYLNNAVQNNKIIAFDPNYRSALYDDQKQMWIERTKLFAAQATILKLSEEEATMLCSKEEQDSFFATLGPKITFITLGARGVKVITAKEKMLIPSIEVQQIDTTGAGDTFFGYVVAQMVGVNLDFNNFTIEQIYSLIQRANLAGALVTTKQGSAQVIPSLETIDQWEKKLWKEES